MNFDKKKSKNIKIIKFIEKNQKERGGGERRMKKIKKK